MGKWIAPKCKPPSSSKCYGIKAKRESKEVLFPLFSMGPTCEGGEYRNPVDKRRKQQGHLTSALGIGGKQLKKGKCPTFCRQFCVSEVPRMPRMKKHKQIWKLWEIPQYPLWEATDMTRNSVMWGKQHSTDKTQRTSGPGQWSRVLKHILYCKIAGSLR